MPGWGLTNQMRESRPWGLPPDLLKPAKVQTDAIHGDIYWLEIERQLIDTPAYQRLRYVKQLGMTSKIYPSAEHSRFTHGLGTLRAAQDIVDRTVASRVGHKALPSLYDEWEDADVLPLRLGEATVLARLAALLHDLTHVPFGHTIEDDLQVLTPHDENLPRFEALWAQIPDGPRMAIERAETQSPVGDRRTRLFDELRAIVLDKRDWPGKSLYPFVADVVNNTICADLLDYLKRDHYFTGLPLSVGERFMDSFYISPSNRGSDDPTAERLIIRATVGNELRTDIISEILKYLRYRYEETERALYHRTKLAYDAMLGKLLEMWKDTIWRREAVASYPVLGPAEESFDHDWLRGRVRELAAEDPEEEAEDLVQALDEHVEREMEKLFTSFGDEGLLQHLAWSLDPAKGRGGSEPDKREQAVLALTRMLLDRDHFRAIGHASGRDVLAVAEQRFKQFGGRDARRRLERQAAAWAGVRPSWSVVIWIPSPTMRLKLADVLIERNGLIAELAEWDEDAGTVAKRHRELWAIRVYAATHVRSDEVRRAIVMGYLKDELNLPLRYPDGSEVRSSVQLAVHLVGDERNLSTSERHRLANTVMAARSEVTTFEDLRMRTELQAGELFPADDPQRGRP